MLVLLLEFFVGAFDGAFAMLLEFFVGDIVGAFELMALVEGHLTQSPVTQSKGRPAGQDFCEPGLTSYFPQ